MADRPPFLCELDKNKLIDTQVGFVDTFNYAVRAIDNLEGGKNCTVDWTTPDHPIINVELDDDEEGGGGSGGEVSAVKDVVASTSGSQSGIEIQYVDARPESFIPFGGGGQVSFIGTDNTVTSASSTFYFSKAANTNIVVSASGTTLTIGVYYI